MSATMIISALGMVSSLGLDAATSCAAARAGLSRARELDYFTLWSPDNGEISPVKGHQIPQVTEGFEGEARLATILSAALRDFVKQQPVIDWKSDRLGIYASFPDSYRTLRGFERATDPEIRSKLLDAVQSIPDDITDLEQAQRLTNLAFKMNGISATGTLRFVSRAGNCGVSECVMKVSEDLAQGRIDYAVILAADSLLEETTLTWLKNLGRLKSPAVATGLAPGEAGIVIGIRGHHLKDKSRASVGMISGMAKSEEDHSLFSGKPVLGKALAELLKSLSSDCSPGWIVCDQNGEDYRAMEWGYALVRNKFEVLAMNYPAVSFGDTGAASGGVSIATILHAINRRCAPSVKGIALSVSESSERTYVIVEPLRAIP